MDDAQVADAPEAPIVEEAGQATSEDQAFDFRQHIDEGYRNDPSLSTYKDSNGMAKSLINAQKTVGADKVAIPGSWATEEDWSQVYSKLGRPETADKYDLSFDQGAEENGQWFKETAHKIGLSQNQASQLLAAYGERANVETGAGEVDLESHRVTLEQDLRKDWGDKFDANMAQANNVLAEFGMSDLTEMQMADGKMLGDNPEVIKLFHQIGGFIAERLGEDQFSGRDSQPGLSAADIGMEVTRLTAPGTPYWDKHHPEHEKYVNEALRLREL